MAHRLLHVDVLAGLRGPDRHERVPVIGRGDRDGVELGIFERFPDIDDSLAVLVALVMDVLEAPSQDGFVGVGHVSDLHAREATEAADVRSTPAVEPGHGDAEAIVGSLDLC